MMERRLGQPATQEYLGVHIYKVGERPRYVGFSATARVGRSADRLAANLASFAGLGPLTPAEAIAYELFNTAQSVSTSADARFLLLFMALEALIEQRQRPAEARRLVDEFEELARDRAELADADRRSIVGSLRWLKQESIRQAGLRFCRELGEVEFDGWQPEALYEACYDARNGLTHPSDELPAWSHVSGLLAPLHRLVQHSFNAAQEA
jgi:hypothetical protein